MAYLLCKLIIRIGFWGPLYYNYKKEPTPNSIGIITAPGPLALVQVLCQARTSQRALMSREILSTGPKGPPTAGQNGMRAEVDERWLDTSDRGYCFLQLDFRRPAGNCPSVRVQTLNPIAKPELRDA